MRGHAEGLFRVTNRYTVIMHQVAAFTILNRKCLTKDLYIRTKSAFEIENKRDTTPIGFIGSISFQLINHPVLKRDIAPVSICKNMRVENDRKMLIHVKVKCNTL